MRRAGVNTYFCQVMVRYLIMFCFLKKTIPHKQQHNECTPCTVQYTRLLIWVLTWDREKGRMGLFQTLASMIAAYKELYYEEFKSNKYTYPNQFSQLTSCFQVVTHSNPSNNLMTDVGKVGIQLWFPLTGLKVVVFDKGQLECFADFCQIEDKSSIVVVWTIVWNNKRILPSYKPEPPHRAWERLSSDLFEFKGQQYLLLTDQYSRFPVIRRLTSTTSSAVINHLKSIFAEHGIPTQLMTDNGPQFSSVEFKHFLNVYGMEHVTSSPCTPIERVCWANCPDCGEHPPKVRWKQRRPVPCSSVLLSHSFGSPAEVPGRTAHQQKI